MKTRSWIRKLYARLTPPTARKAPARRQLVLESLEDRAMPSVTFGPPVRYGVGQTPLFMAVGDFNGDGKQDLAVTNLNSDTVSVLLGNGRGTFQSPIDSAAGFNPGAIAVGDFN